MPGMLTKLPDLGSVFKKMQAQQSQETRKQIAINELKIGFESRGFAPWMAEKLATERYLLIHKHDKP